MTDAFEAWINSMSEQDYEDFIDEDSADSGTEAQIEKALNIRQPVSQQEQDDLDALQAGEPEEEEEDTSRVEPVQDTRIPDEIYDNRDLPPVTRTVTIEIPRDNSPPRVLPKQPTTQYQPEQRTINTPTLPRQPIAPIQQPRVQQQIRPSFTQRVRTSISNAFSRLNPFKRGKK